MFEMYGRKLVMTNKESLAVDRDCLDALKEVSTQNPGVLMAVTDINGLCNMPELGIILNLNEKWCDALRVETQYGALLTQKKQSNQSEHYDGFTVEISNDIQEQGIGILADYLVDCFYVYNGLFLQEVQ